MQNEKSMMQEVLEYLAKAITLEIKIFKIKMAEQGKIYSDDEIVSMIMEHQITSKQDYGEESIEDFREKFRLFQKVKKCIEA